MARRRRNLNRGPRRFWWFNKQDHLAEARDVDGQVGWPSEGPEPGELWDERNWTPVKGFTKDQLNRVF